MNLAPNWKEERNDLIQTLRPALVAIAEEAGYRKRTGLWFERYPGGDVIHMAHAGFQMDMPDVLVAPRIAIQFPAVTRLLAAAGLIQQTRKRPLPSFQVMAFPGDFGDPDGTYWRIRSAFWVPALAERWRAFLEHGAGFVEWYGTARDVLDGWEVGNPRFQDPNGTHYPALLFVTGDEDKAIAIARSRRASYARTRGEDSLLVARYSRFLAFLEEHRSG